jgi:hypothetical protein
MGLHTTLYSPLQKGGTHYNVGQLSMKQAAVLQEAAWSAVKDLKERPLNP